MTDDAKVLLESLRLKPEQKFFNHFEWVWLKQVPPAGDMHGYLTDCCEVASPCDWHKAMERANSKEGTA